MALRRASSEAGVLSTTTSIAVVVDDDAEPVALGRGVASASRTARLASSIFSPRHRARAVEDEGEVDGRALASCAVAGGAVTSTRTKRWLRLVGRMRRRSARAVRRVMTGSPSSRSRAIAMSRSTCLAVGRGSGRRTWSSMSGREVDALPLGAFERVARLGCRGRRRGWGRWAAPASSAGRVERAAPRWRECGSAAGEAADVVEGGVRRRPDSGSSARARMASSSSEPSSRWRISASGRCSRCSRRIRRSRARCVSSYLAPGPGDTSTASRPWLM